MGAQDLRYIKLSQWKKEVLDHCNSGLEETKALMEETEALMKVYQKDGLKQILYEFYEIKDHLE